jgi:transcriptional regulator of acetoin/glycerol metabolism
METNGSASLKEVRKEHILKVLRATQGDVAQACRILGISVGTLRRSIKELGIAVEEDQDRTKT